MFVSDKISLNQIKADKYNDAIYEVIETKDGDLLIGRIKHSIEDDDFWFAPKSYEFNTEDLSMIIEVINDLKKQKELNDLIGE